MSKSKFQKAIFSKIDNAVQEYVEKRDMGSATAFAIKIKEKLEFIFEAFNRIDINALSKDKKIAILKSYQQKVDDNIKIVKNEVLELMLRAGKSPSYIGFILTNNDNNERRFE